MRANRASRPTGGAPASAAPIIHHRWKLFPLSIRTSLVAIVLPPLAISIGLASTVVVSQSSIRGQAVTARRSSLYLDSLLRARIDVYTEYVDTASIVAGQAYHVSNAELNSILGLNVRAAMIHARRGSITRRCLGRWVPSLPSTRNWRPCAERSQGAAHHRSGRVVLQWIRLDH